jgi:aryl-alcohol dehydrogenase-like predicted oxidoreductase
MEYATLGATGLEVSRLSLGLGLRGQPDEAEACRLIEHAVNAGVNLLDCANVYAPGDDRSAAGRSEAILGRAVRDRRDEVVIATKVGGRVRAGANNAGLSKRHVVREVEHSLERLGTDRIDVLYVHVFDGSTRQEETIRALDQLVHQGKVLYLGCCNHQAWQACRALWIADNLRAEPYVCLQNPYSLLNRDLECEMFGLARDQKLGLVTYSPLAIGLLSGEYQSDAEPPDGSPWTGTRRTDYRRIMSGSAGAVVSQLKASAAELGRSPAEVAVAWVLSHPEVSSCISGADTVEQLDGVLGGIGWALPAEIRQRLDGVSESAPWVR